MNGLTLSIRFADPIAVDDTELTANVDGFIDDITYTANVKLFCDLSSLEVLEAQTIRIALREFDSAARAAMFLLSVGRSLQAWDLDDLVEVEVV